MILMIGILFGVLTITFFVGRVLPNSPATLVLGDRPTAEQVATAEEELGLNKPLIVQYALYVGQVAQGNFGKSLRTHQPVLVEIRNRLGATFELTTLAIIIVIVVGVPLGVLSAVWQNSLIDNLARAGGVGGVAIPAFMLAMILQIVFYGQLNWLPLQGRMDSVTLLDVPFDKVTGLFLVDTLLAGEWGAFKSAVRHIILPTLTLSIVTLASVTRITRNMMVDLTYGYLLGGAVVVEFVFDWPGLGGFLVFSIVQNDFPAVLGTTLFLAATYLTINLIVDLLYFIVDPRLRAQ
jgi:peptide/nickel transport system permease protein